MLFHDIWTTIRITIIPYLLLLLCLAAMGFLLFLNPMARESAGSVILFVVLAVIIATLVGSWVAVSWHRYGLLNERPGALLPVWDGALVWLYVKAALRLILVSLIVIILPIMVLAAGVASSGGTPQSVALYQYIIVIPASFVLYRVAVILPAAAMNQPLTLRDAWLRTRGSTLALVPFLVLQFVLSFVAEGLVAPPVVKASVQVLVGYFNLLIGLSVLTTLYGHFIEKRELR